MTNEATSAVTIRQDLRDVHRSSLHHVTSAGTSLGAAQRRRIAEVARDAYLSADPSAPWVAPFDQSDLNLAYRLARHAATVTKEWVGSLGLDPLVVLEVVGIVIAIVPVTAFARAIGEDQPPLPSAAPGSPTGNIAPDVTDPTINWFPVARSFGSAAAVVQALSALPAESENLWRLAAAQYMSEEQMDDPAWSRGALSRAQAELIAGRISKLRECFY